MIDLFALVHIRYVQLDLRPIERLQRIKDRDGGEGPGRGIDDDTGGAPSGGVDRLDEFAFEIRLTKVNGNAEPGGVGFAPFAYLVQRG